MKKSLWIGALLFSLIFASPDVFAAAPKKKGTTAHKVTSKKRRNYKPPVHLKKTKKKTKARSSAQHKRVAPKKRPVKKQISQAAKKVAPKKNVKKHPGTLIVIDPGHGGFDLGASSHSVIEKILCLSTGLLVKKHLNALGYRVVLTRTRDVFISLKRRTDIANSVRGKLFLSIHYNAAKSASASGIEVYYYKSKDALRARESKKLATTVLGRMLQQTGALSRGVKQGNFHVIRETNMPAILIEGGFITHSQERQKVSDGSYREKLARAIADGVDRYCRGKI